MLRLKRPYRSQPSQQIEIGAPAFLYASTFLYLAYRASLNILCHPSGSKADAGEGRKYARRVPQVAPK